MLSSFPAHLSTPMTCTDCGFELSPEFVFCPRCGRRQPISCLACGLPCEADFAFCPRCGTARKPDTPAGFSKTPPTATTEAVNPDADRRQVTVLFADVSGFTSLAERLDPEEVRAFQNALFEMLGDAITRYDGFVEKFVGDAAMAVFGAPLAHEDDPERALRACRQLL
jgi:adenylate cyclase